MGAPTLTVGLPNFGGYFGGDWSRLLCAARAAEDAGIHRVVINDHVVMGNHTEAYTWGRFPVLPDAPWLEPISTLTAIAGATSSIRLGTSVLIAPLRSAALLAKSVATLDVLSGGRIDLGVGVGWQKEEYTAAGLDFSSRGQALTDTMAACRALWESLPASFSSATVAFEDIYCSPQPAQPRLPIWFGGSLNARNLHRIVELGDGWIVIMGASLEDIAAGASAIMQTSPGRRIEIQAPAVMSRNDDGTVDLARTLSSVPELVKAGVTDIYVNIQTIAPDHAASPRALAKLCKAFEEST